MRGTSRKVALLVAVAALAGCGDGHAIVVRFGAGASAEGARGVELDLTRSCGTGSQPWEAPESALESLRFRADEPPPRLGRVRPGTYALRARVRDETCAIVAAGCAEIDVKPFDDGTPLEVVVEPVDGPPCDPAVGCVGGLCEGPADADGDGDVDGDADGDDDGDVDADVDGCPSTPGWTRSIGAGQLPGPEVALGPDGSLVIIGHFPGTVDLDPGPGVVEHSSTEELTLYVLKLDGQGRYLWSGTIDGSGVFLGQALSVTDVGDVVIVGHFENTVDLDPGPGVDEHTSEGLSDIFIVRLDGDGALRWARTAGGPRDDWAMGVDVGGEDLIAVSGLFTGAADLSPGPSVDSRVAEALDDAFVMLLDGGGEAQWIRTFPGDGEGLASQVALTYDASTDHLRAVTTAGEFMSTMDLDPGPGENEVSKEGNFTGFVASFVADGELDWAHVVGGFEISDRTLFTNLVSAPGADLVATGYYEGWVDLLPGMAEDLHYSRDGSSDLFVLRLSSSGERQWAVETGGPGADFVSDADIAPDGSVVLVGTHADGFDFDPGPDEILGDALGFTDGYILRLDPDGHHDWGRSISSILVDTASGVAVSPEGWLAVTGVFTAPFDFDPGPCVDEHDNAVTGSSYFSRLLRDGFYDR